MTAVLAGRQGAAPGSVTRGALPTGRSGAAPKGPVLDAARGFGMMVGPSAFFDLFLAGGVVETVRGMLAWPRTRLGRLARPVAGFGAVLAVVYPTIIRPWMLLGIKLRAEQVFLLGQSDSST